MVSSSSQNLHSLPFNSWHDIRLYSIYGSPFPQWRLSNCFSLKKYPCPGTELFWLLVTPRYSIAEILPCGIGESSIRRHTSSATAHAFFPMTLLLCASSSDVERDWTSTLESLCRRGYVSNTSGYFCHGGSGGRVRCFRVGICEGSYINPFWEVGGPRFFSQKISKIPRPTPHPPSIKNVPSLMCLCACNRKK